MSIIGRIRGDAKLSFLPQSSGHIRPRRIYGAAAPNPEQLRQDDTHVRQTVRAHVAGTQHDFRIKVLKKLALASGRRARSPTYRYRPATLPQICIPYMHRPSADIASVRQAYLWRWDIEVNLRDEKTLLGVGQAKVRNPAATLDVPQMMVAAYSLLLAAATDVYGVKAGRTVLPMPKWRKRHHDQRASTMDLIKALRTELWADTIEHTAATHFANPSPNCTKSSQLTISPNTAILYVAAQPNTRGRAFMPRLQASGRIV